MQFTLSVAAVMMAASSTVSAHMIFNSGAVWGAKTLKGAIETPLTANTKNWLHHGAARDTDEFITLAPNSSPSFPITCGEAVLQPEKASSICKTPADAHQGGGCAISISYPDASGKPQTSQNDFKVISVAHDCPKHGVWNHVFPMPANLPACAECVCAWHWVPNPASSADESYMNTFNCKVSGGNGGKITNGKLPIYFAVPGGVSGGNPRPMYKAWQNGAQPLTIGDAGNTGTQVPPPSTGNPPTTGNNGNNEGKQGGKSAENGGWYKGYGRGRGNGRRSKDNKKRGHSRRQSRRSTA